MSAYPWKEFFKTVGLAVVSAYGGAALVFAYFKPLEVSEIRKKITAIPVTHQYLKGFDIQIAEAKAQLFEEFRQKRVNRSSVAATKSE